MATIADVYRALNAMQSEKIVEKYAVCGGTAALFYDSETLRTYDIDIYVFIPQSGILVSLTPIYDWARSRGYGVDSEHLIIHNVPVQVLSVNPGLESEALESANSLDYDGVPVSVVKPEFLILIYGKVGGRNRIRRALDLIENADVDFDLIDGLAAKYGLEDVWNRLKEQK